MDGHHGETTTTISRTPSSSRRCLLKKTGGQPSLPCSLLEDRKVLAFRESLIWAIVALGILLLGTEVQLLLSSHFPSDEEGNYSSRHLRSSGDSFLQIRMSSLSDQRGFSYLAMAHGDRDATEMRQDEHQAADLAEVIAWICKYCRLKPPHCQDVPIRGTKCLRNISHSMHSVSVVMLPIGDTSEDLLENMDKKISLPHLSLKLKKLVKLLPFSDARAC